MKSCSCGCNESFEKNIIVNKIINDVAYTDEVYEVKCKKCGNLLFGRVTPLKD